MTHADQTPDASDRRRLRLGLALIVIGLAIMAKRLDLWELHFSREFWPVIPLAIGVLHILVGGRRKIRGGMWLIYVGVWGLISEFHFFGLDYGTSWPLLIIAVGLNTVWRSLESPHPRNAQEN
jgi:hypothetical protein